MTPSVAAQLPRRSSGRIGTWLALILALAALGIFLSLRLESAELVRFTVTRGESAREIAAGLRSEKLIWHPWTFLIWVRLHGRRGLRPGIYALSRQMTGRTIYSVLRQGPPLVRVTFPEGWTAQQIAALLETKGITAAGPFLEIVARDQKEGFLFPDTYFFEQGTEPSEIVNRTVRRFHEKEPKDMTAQAKVLKLNYRQIVTLASIVEREARVAQERPLIAGVFYNRLKKRWRLESCATVEYALGRWKPKLSYKDLEVASPYNTYQHMGLPPGPIGNPGAAALDAAVHPATTDMMFFVAEGGGTHRFSKYYNEHLAAQKKGKGR